MDMTKENKRVLKKKMLAQVPDLLLSTSLVLCSISFLQLGSRVDYVLVSN